MKGKANHPMEDYHVAKFVQIQRRELGLFGIFDGHLGDSVPAYLQKHLFSNILKEVCPHPACSGLIFRTLPLFCMDILFLSVLCEWYLSSGWVDCSLC